MLITPAYAQASGAVGGFDPLQFLPLVLIFVVFWFLLIRPQQKKMKQHKEMLTALRRGDRVLTGGGIFGTITKVGADNEVQVEIADGVRVRVDKGTISAVLARTEPARNDEADEAEDEDEAKGRGARGG
jgi:preprotein translocase subunit YajC